METVKHQARNRAWSTVFLFFSLFVLVVQASRLPVGTREIQFPNQHHRAPSIRRDKLCSQTIDPRSAVITRERPVPPTLFAHALARPAPATALS
jgi:hypothetical protein